MVDEANIESHGMGFEPSKTLARHEGFLEVRVRARARGRARARVRVRPSP